MILRSTTIVLLVLLAAAGSREARGSAFDGDSTSQHQKKPAKHNVADEISIEEVRSAAAAFLGRRFPEHASRLQVRVVRVGGSDHPAGRLTVGLSHAEGVPRGHTQVRLFANGSDVGWALLYVAHFDSVAIIQVDAADDEPIELDEIGVAWLDVTTFRGEPLRPADLREQAAAGPIFAANPLRAGDALRSNDIRSAWAANTGQAVLMTYRTNAVTLRLSCQAREPGATGDVIRLYNPDTKTTYKARLTGPGVAEWISTQ